MSDVIIYAIFIWNLFNSLSQNFSQALLCNVLEEMMKPNFESPIHTARDLVERDITLYLYPGTQLWRQLLSQSDILEYRKIAKTMIITKSWDKFYKKTKNAMLSQGTHATMRSSFPPDVLAWGTEYDYDQGRYVYNSGRGYYRGERVVLAGVMSEAGYLTNKKWHLNEVTHF